MEKKLWKQIAAKGFVKIYVLTASAKVIELVTNPANGFTVEMLNNGFIKVTI